MKKSSYGWCAFILLLMSCGTGGVFSSKSPRQQYAERLEQAGLHRSVLGMKWLEQSRRAMETSLAVNIPYRESGYFAADIPRSAGFRLRPKRGQRLLISIDIRPGSGVHLFVELWKNTGNINKPKLVMAADSLLTIRYEVDDDPELLLILQPELLAAVSYTLTITAEPSLAFPVPGNSGTRVGSFWGDQRNGGTRKHEGIDIFDKFRTPLVAAEDGIITRVGENGLGGKVIWLKPSGKPYNLYYAHLDEQLVSAMQRVKRGDTIGLMGNTGNARNTPTHLHFGIYAAGGAVDPLPFVQQVPKETEPVRGVLLNVSARTNRKVILQNTPAKKSVTISELPAHTFIRIEAAMGSYYKVVLPDETSGFIPISAVSPVDQSIRTQRTQSEQALFAQPDSGSAIIDLIPSATNLSVLAFFGEYAYAGHGELRGWIGLMKPEN